MSDQQTLSVKGRDILRHALGLSRGTTAYRNHYVAGPGHDCMPELLALESSGLVERVPAPSFYSTEDIVFRVTPAGIEAVSHD